MEREATAELLWAACRPVPDDRAVDAAIAAGADVDRAIDAALAQGAGPMLARGLADRAVGATAERLAKEAEVRRAQGLVLYPTALALAVEPLTAAGLEPLLFKGPTLAARYPAPGLRPMVDIDVLLPAADHAGAVGALTAAGWQIRNRAGDHHDTLLVHPDAPGLPLELHRDLYVWHDRATSLTADDLWSQRVPAECLGVSAFVLPPEVDLVALAAHAGKPEHHFNRLVWSIDFAVVVGAGVDWARVDDVAARARCRTVVTVALHHAARLGAAVPAQHLDLRAGRVRREALAALLAVDWPLVEQDEGTHRRLRYALWDSAPRRVALFFGEIAVTGPRYAPRRALRLTGNLLRRVWRTFRAPAGSP